MQIENVYCHTRWHVRFQLIQVRSSQTTTYGPAPALWKLQFGPQTGQLASPPGSPVMLGRHAEVIYGVYHDAAPPPP